MSSKLVLSLAAALTLSAASGVARADPNAPSSDETSQVSRSPTNEEVNAAETGIPASVDYPNRATSKHSPTNDEIDAAEAGNPYSPDYKDRPSISADGPSNEEWHELESGNPHSTDRVH